MKAVFFYFLCTVFAIHSRAQKPMINDTTYKVWTTISDGHLSNDGHFAYYTINNKPINERTIVAIATDRSWQKEFRDLSNLTFSADSKFLYAIQGIDSLVKLDLRSKSLSYVSKCNRFELVAQNDFEYLIYQFNSDCNRLTIRNLTKNKIILETNSSDYIVFKDVKTILIRQNLSLKREIMKSVNLISGISKTIYDGRNTKNHIFDPIGNNLAFTSETEGRTEIWYFNREYAHAERICDDLSIGILDGHKILIDNCWKFTSDGKGLFFTQISKNLISQKIEPTIWSYKDAYLRSFYNKNIQNIFSGMNLSILDIDRHQIRQLLDGTKKVKGGIPDQNNDVIIVESSFALDGDIHWNKYAKYSYYLCFAKTGKLKLIAENIEVPIRELSLSPDKLYLVYFDPEQNQYVCLNIKTNKQVTIGRELSGKLFKYFISDRGKMRGTSIQSAILGWLPNKKHVILQGTFDLWEVDLENKIKPVNLTKYLGDKKSIIFSFLYDNNRMASFKGDEDIFLSGFNTINKDYGIYNLNLGTGKLKKLYEDKNYLGQPYETISSTVFIEAKMSHSFVLAKIKSNNSFNYTFTKDFKTFHDLSKNYPERDYNWITSKLIKYNDGFGNECEGILYKPENFDSLKRYPIIFDYYLDVSNNLNSYILPEPSGVGINIPLLASNGYLVVTPNIYRINGNPGEAALTSVIAAANYLSKFKWADTSKMGISGHSFGGFETNYIVANSSRFKAGLVGAGPSNLIETYNELWEFGDSRQGYVKNKVYNMIGDLDSLRFNYVNNSPILFAGNIKTPLLLLHNNLDNAVPVTQSLNLFVRLRSLNKPTWLIQYKDEKHTLLTEMNQLDFQKKANDFFDHYLKDRPAPTWMIDHIQPPSNIFLSN